MEEEDVQKQIEGTSQEITDISGSDCIFSSCFANCMVLESEIRTHSNRKLFPAPIR